LVMKGAAQTGAGWLKQTLTGLDWLSARRGRAPALPGHLLTGIDGEEAACSYLHRKGYTVTARRWSAGNLPGDLDLIAWQGPMLCFFEVKTRTARDKAPAEAAVDTHKQNLLCRLASQYVRQLPGKTAPEVRFDVISVYLVPGQKREITHFENAFGWNERRRGGD
jgi:putative endonuclease